MQNLICGFNFPVAWIDCQTAKFNFPPNFFSNIICINQIIFISVELFFMCDQINLCPDLKQDRKLPRYTDLFEKHRNDHALSLSYTPR